MGATLFLSVWGFLKSVPREVWLILAALAALWAWGNHREALGRQEGRAEVQAKWDDARAKAQAESDRIAAKNAETTRKADTDVAQELAQERTGADAFIARGGVRPCPAARANPGPQGESPTVDARASEVPVLDDVPVVTVLPDDVRICTENTVKARAWREWGLSIEANNSPAE